MQGPLCDDVNTIADKSMRCNLPGDFLFLTADENFRHREGFVSAGLAVRFANRGSLHDILSLC